MPYSDYLPAGTTRTAKRGIERHIPYLPDYFNHQWFEDFITDFLTGNILENNGVISGCVISQDGGNDAFNITNGVIFVGGNKVEFTAPATYEFTTDGFKVVYITSAGSMIVGEMDNASVQGAVTPSNAVIVGYAIRGGGSFYIIAFSNNVSLLSTAIDKSETRGADYILGTQAQVTAGTATVYYDDSTSLFRDKDDLEVTFVDGEKIKWIGIDALTGPIDLSAIDYIDWDLIPGNTISLGSQNLQLGVGHRGELDLSGTGTITSTKSDGLRVNISGGLSITDTGGDVVVNNILKSIASNFFDHIIGTSAQLTADECTIAWDGTKFVDKDSDEVTIQDGERIKVVGTTLSADIEFTADRLYISMGGGSEFNLNGYKIIISGDKGRYEINTDEDYDNGLEDETKEDQRVIKNRGFKNRIWLNNRLIFSGDVPTFFFTPIEQKDPYIIYENGDWNNGIPDTGSNDGENCFCDMWKYLGGDETLQIGPCWNPLSATSQWKYITTAADGGRFIRPVSLGDGTVDPAPHTRTHPTALGAATVISTYTSSASAEISGISDADILKVKVGCRVYDAGENIPQYVSGTPKTTVISKIVHNGADDNSIFLIDSESRDPVSVTASGDLTVDWGGNTGLSYQDFALQEFQVGASEDFDGARDYYGSIDTRDYRNNGTTIANDGRPLFKTTSQGSASKLKPMDDGTNGPPQMSTETRPTSVNRFGAWKQ